MALFSSHIGIDLGTTNTLIYVRGQGIILNEPSAVAVSRKKTGNGAFYGQPVLEAVGREALDLAGRTPEGIEVIYPLRSGVIADMDFAERMLRYFVERAIGRTLMKPSVTVCIPCRLTEVEEMAMLDTLRRIGVRSVQLMEEPLAAALGAGMDVMSPSGLLVVDIGGGTTDVAIVSLGEVQLSESVPVAGDTLDEAIMDRMKQEYGLEIGYSSARILKEEIGTVDEGEIERRMKIQGKSITSGLPKEVEVSSDVLLRALKPLADELIRSVKRVMESAPPELISDISEKGALLTGGGSLLRGLGRIMSEALKLEVFTADNPLLCVAYGTGEYVENQKKFGTRGRRVEI